MRNNRTRIQRLCRYFQYLFFGWLVAIPIVHVCIWIWFNRLPSAMPQEISGMIQRPIAPSILAIAGIVSFALSALQMAMVWMLIRLFRLYRNGKFFLAENVSCLWNISKLLLAQAIATPVVKASLSMILSFANPPGQRMLNIGLDFSDISTAITGGIVFVIAYVMEEGRKLQDEQALTI